MPSFSAMIASWAAIVVGQRRKSWRWRDGTVAVNLCTSVVAMMNWRGAAAL
jgi:hypothetical protein